MHIYVVEIWDRDTHYWEEYTGFSEVEKAIDTYRTLIFNGRSVRLVLHVHMEEYWSKEDEEALA